MDNIIKLLQEYGPTVFTTVMSILALLQWISKDLAIVISQADKNNDDKLSNEELEDLAVLLVKKSNNKNIKIIPDFLIRLSIRYICKQRKNAFKGINIKNVKSLLKTE